jgi:hypothetical protein
LAAVAAAPHPANAKAAAAAINRIDRFMLPPLNV